MDTAVSFADKDSTSGFADKDGTESYADKDSDGVSAVEREHLPMPGDEGVDEVASKSEEQSGRQRSTIKFPYNDLDDAVELARTLYQNRGGRALISELAAELGQSANSGSFRLRLSAARMFGLIEIQSKQVTLAPLGQAIIDPGKEAASRVEAFLEVPLYKRIYDEFNDTQLPGDPGLEARIRNFGVTPNQLSRARQVFMRAAEQAGFFKTAGRRRLVAPPVSSMGGESRGEQQLPKKRDLPQDGGEGDPLSDPMLNSLLQRMLPPVTEKFTARDRRRLFTALAVNLDVVYGPPPDGHVDYREIEKIIAVDDRSNGGSDGQTPSNG